MSMIVLSVKVVKGQSFTMVNVNSSHIDIAGPDEGVSVAVILTVYTPTSKTEIDVIVKREFPIVGVNATNYGGAMGTPAFQYVVA